MARGAAKERVAYGEGRQALIDAAIRIVARDGLTKLTTRALTSASGVSQGSLQHHFPDMNELLGAALEQCATLTMSYLTPPGDLSEVFDMLYEALARHPIESTFQSEIFLEARRHPALLAVVSRYQDRYSENLRSTLLALGLEPDEDLVQLLMAVGDGMAYEFAVFGDAQLENTQRQVAAVHRLLASRAGSWSGFGLSV